MSNWIEDYHLYCACAGQVRFLHGAIQAARLTTSSSAARRLGQPSTNYRAPCQESHPALSTRQPGQLQRVVGRPGRTFFPGMELRTHLREGLRLLLLDGLGLNHSNQHASDAVLEDLDCARHVEGCHNRQVDAVNGCLGCRVEILYA